MKFRKGQKALKVPPMGDLIGAYLDFPGGGNPLQLVHMDYIQQMRKRYPKDQAPPAMIAHALGANEVHLWPTPDRGGVIKITYYPIPEEI